MLLLDEHAGDEGGLSPIDARPLCTVRCQVASRENRLVLSTVEVVERLRALAEVRVPLWLAGGVAVDFHVGRWTRAHADVDLVAFHRDRGPLAEALSHVGVLLAQDGAWTTKWSFRGRQPADIEIVFVEHSQPERASGTLVIPRDDATGARAGRYPFVEGYLSLTRWAELDGVRFRVTSAEGEWLNRAKATGGGVIPGRRAKPELAHDRRLLEALVSERRRGELLAFLSGREDR